MTDDIGNERQRAHIAALSHEIYRLSRELEENEKKAALKDAVDPDDPFGNPTEYSNYREDYRKVVPQLDSPGYRMPLDPVYEERRRLRFFYGTAGVCALFQFFISNILGNLVSSQVFAALKSHNRGVDDYALYDYFNSSSISAALNMLVFIVSNVLAAVIGMRAMGISPQKLVKTHGFRAGNAVKYCLAASFIYISARLLGLGVEDIFNHYRFTTHTISAGNSVTYLGVALTLIYTIIIAPVTEELLYRGVLLKGFSIANQRFGVFASAFMFGLAHKNIPQFLIAFSVGIFLAHITQKHGSIIPSIIVHMFINFFSIAVSILWSLHPVEARYYSTLLIMIIGMIALMIFRSSDKLPSSTPMQSRRGASIALSAPMLIISVIIQLSYMFSRIFGVYELDIFWQIENIFKI